jgi:hypothetical protein
MYILLSDDQSFIIIVVEKWAQSIVSFNLYSRYANSLLCFDCDDGVFYLFYIIWTLVYTTTVAL